METIVQTLLQRELANGSVRQQTVWLPQDKRVRVGTVITLKGDQKNYRWKVIAQYQKDELAHINLGWGLNLPKKQRTER